MIKFTYRLSKCYVVKSWAYKLKCKTRIKKYLKKTKEEKELLYEDYDKKKCTGRKRKRYKKTFSKHRRNVSKSKR